MVRPGECRRSEHGGAVKQYVSDSQRVQYSWRRKEKEVGALQRSGAVCTRQWICTMVRPEGCRRSDHREL
jgi:hypothetical protein